MALERNKNNLDIASYGMSDTTLEEIFLLLTSRDENGELSTPITALNNRLVEANGSSTNPISTLSASMESDRDSGVAIELNSFDATSNEFLIKKNE